MMNLKKFNVIVYSIFVLSIIVLFSFTKWELADKFFFFLSFLEILIYILLAIAFIWSIIYATRTKKFIPLLINIITLVLLLFFPFTKIVLEIDYNLNKFKRNEVVQRISSNSINTQNNTNFKLPSEYKHLSKSGEILISPSKNYVIFYTFRGILGNYSGFVYSLDGSIPTGSTLGDIITVEKKDHNWYWVSSF